MKLENKKWIGGFVIGAVIGALVGVAVQLTWMLKLIE